MTYADLDINQKIQTKAALQAWARYSIEHFGEQIDKKVYRVRSTKTGLKRGNKTATGALKQTWYQTVSVGKNVDKVMLQFLLYGRFVDMGVGRGTTHTDRLVTRQLREGKPGRTRKPWYSKRKSYEIKRLREVLADQNIHLALEAMETTLNLTVHIQI